MVLYICDKNVTAHREDSDKPRGYYACLVISLLPILVILWLPLLELGFSGLPGAILMSGIVILPLLSCGIGFKGRPLFQFHYHGTPFEEEIMKPIEDDRTI